MQKIKIELKECCLTCEHFDPSGIKGLNMYYTTPPCGCGEPERVIACGHIEVCAKYCGKNIKNMAKSNWTQILPTTRNSLTIPHFGCGNCGYLFDSATTFCPHCGAKNRE